MNLGLITSTLLKQQAETTKETSINMLNANIFITASTLSIT